MSQPAYTVKYPPRMVPRPSPGGGPEIAMPPRASSNQLVAVSDIVRKLEFATKENVRLKEAIEENNRFLEEKLQNFSQNQNGDSMEIEALKEAHKKNIEAHEKEIQEYKNKVSDATNRFFEARVAVMGFKCRVMQLQGELEKKGGPIQESPRSLQQEHSRSEIDSLKSKNYALEQDCQRLHQQLQQQNLRLQEIQQQNQFSRPGNSEQAYILKEKNKTLENDRMSLSAVNMALRKDMEAMGDKQRHMEEEKGRLTHQLNHLQDQMRDKDSHIQQLNTRLAQSQNHHDHTLQGQIQELTLRKNALEGDVARMRCSNDELLTKVRELQTARDSAIKKVEEMHSFYQPSGPTPKPRGGEKERSEQQIRQLQTENMQLSQERDRAVKDKNTVDSLFQESTRKSQHLSEQIVELEGQERVLRAQLEENQRKLERERSNYFEEEKLRKECESLRSSVQELKGEKTGIVSQVTRLEKLNQALQTELQELDKSKGEIRSQCTRYRNEIAELEEKLNIGASVSMDSPDKSLTSKKMPPLAKRLNDAIGRIKQLEAEKDAVDTANESTARQTRLLIVEKENLEDQLKVEMEKNKKTTEQDVAHLKTEIEQLREKERNLKGQILQMETEQQDMVQETLSLKQEVDRYRQSLTIHDTEKRGMSRQISEKEIEMERLKDQLKAAQERIDEEVKAKEKKAEKLDNLQQNYTELKTRHATLNTDLQKLKSEDESKRTQLHTIGTEKTKMEVEKQDLQATCEEFKKESESILMDYRLCADQLRVAQDEVTRQQQKFATERLQMNERIKLLEDTRRDLEEKLNHMDQQIKIYHEDFDRERNAREAAVKVKNLAEERMKKVDRELKELRDRLNQQAVHNMRNEPSYEGNSYLSTTTMDTHETPHRYSGPHNRSREHYSGPQMGQPAWSGNGGHAPRPQQKSGEIHNFGGSTIDGGPSIPIPAMQQGGEYRRATGQPPRAGGQMNPGAWTTNQAPHRAFNDNIGRPQTAMVPPVSQYSRDEHPPQNSKLRHGGFLPTDVGGGNQPSYPMTPPVLPHPRDERSPQHSTTRPGEPDNPLEKNQQQPWRDPVQEPPPMEPCPFCGRADFKTQRDLQVHCDQHFPN